MDRYSSSSSRTLCSSGELCSQPDDVPSATDPLVFATGCVNEVVALRTIHILRPQNLGILDCLPLLLVRISVPKLQNQIHTNSFISSAIWGIAGSSPIADVICVCSLGRVAPEVSGQKVAELRRVVGDLHEANVRLQRGEVLFSSSRRSCLGRQHVVVDRPPRRYQRAPCHRWRQKLQVHNSINQSP